MAILNSMWTRGTRKRLGGSVIYQAMGQTRQRELASSVSNPRTDAQMNQRVKWANLVNFYRANKSWMKYAFETKKESQSEYNKFMSLNVADSNIYLPKHIAAGGGCVVQNYLITQGSLPSIEQVQSSTGWDTNILLQDGIQNFAQVTIGEFSTKVIEGNPAIREGDQLSFIRITQQTNGDTGVPYIVVRQYELIMDKQSQERFVDYFPANYFTSENGSNGYMLGVRNLGNAGGWALILSRTISGRTYVSTQRVVVANNSTLIDYYSSSAALQAAIASYGASEDAFLSTVTANQDTQAPVLWSILSMIYAPDQLNFAAGSRAEIPEVQGKEQFVFELNANMTADPSSITLVTNKGNIVLGNFAHVENLVSGETSEEMTTLENVVVFYALVVIGSSTYRIDFVVRNSDTIEGME